MATSLLRTFLLIAVCSLQTRVFAETWLDNNNREDAWALFTYRYWDRSDTPIGFTGNVATLDPGTTSDAFKAAILNRYNYFRAVVGIRPVVLDPVWTRKCQAGAFVLALNRKLTHSIDPSFIGYSQDAEDGAGHSVISGGVGPSSVDAYMFDSGSNNLAVGHRNAIMEPTSSKMGTGDAWLQDYAGPGLASAVNAIWNDGQNEYVPHRDAFEAWPTPGYVPWPLVPNRWNLHIDPRLFFTPNGRGMGDFTNAVVTVTANGVPLPVEVLSRTTESISWQLPSDNILNEGMFTSFRGNTVYHVKISGQTFEGLPMAAFEYDVRVFDPAEEPTIGAFVGPQSVQTGSAVPFSKASSRRGAVYALAADGYSNNAESTAGITTNVTRSAILSGVQKTSGATAFAIPLATGTPQTLTLRDRFIPDLGTTVSWNWLEDLRRYGTQVYLESRKLCLQVNAFDGAGWKTLWSSPSTGTKTFVTQTVSLAAYAGREIAIRFSGEMTGFLSNDGSGVAADLPPVFYIDDIAVTGRHYAEIASIPIDPTTGATWTPTAPGVYRVALASRYFDQWDGAAGASSELTVTGAAQASTLSNLSIRSTAGTDSQTLIMGFVVAGGTKSLLARGIGPALIPYGVTDAVKDPALGVYSGSAVVRSNDNWGTAASNPVVAKVQASVGAFPLPDSSQDAVIFTALAPGNYTAQITGVGGTTGVALAELYDTETASPARLTNVSARSQVGTGANILITGFNINGPSPKKLLIRAVGPALANYGVTGTLAHPVLKLYSGQTVLFTNQKWGTAASNPDIVAAVGKVGAFPLADGSNDAALVVSLVPGAYTATVEGLNSETGVALVEVYDVP